MRAGLAGLVLCGALAGMARAECDEAVADLRWDGGQARFAVEIADDAEERAHGLMARESLPVGAGMLFIYDHAQPVSFWMKNTLIPLDMIFLDAAGTVTAVHPEAKPGDLTPIPGPDNTLMVLEINGGLAARLGIAPGAEMRHPRIDRDGAAWRCPRPKIQP
ncbi:MAG: DUF192 domain-containing protein [Defluviimonas sp.]|uniref:DUF192 domain-containing protein n=1 Tax=Albidovulum sp. TaxID=1872424 RepID=UPI001D7817F9|nr:DUF192 domain-containing protein [Paracoccaceae bacterium]MCC0064273.1 DUF192 domain-containing protein [Defluviimonas sp.]